MGEGGIVVDVKAILPHSVCKTHQGWMLGMSFWVVSVCVQLRRHMQYCGEKDNCGRNLFVSCIAPLHYNSVLDCRDAGGMPNQYSVSPQRHRDLTRTLPESTGTLSLGV